MVTGIFVPSKGEPQLREFRGLSDYQRAVGGLIEAVEVAALGITVYVNEEGLLRQLPSNILVTLLCLKWSPELGPRSELVGNAVIVGSPDASGAATDVPASVPSLLAAMRPEVQ
ncbi:DUF3846 domain-containing protein [Galbitalea soli]|uniref:DUF3846 domain-containing protein n=1 Tax=Galbitalea soli TaxID=1268042 RepID=A0A7C9TQF2_9MICO|nr:DUF3846 domain-containing protein [Galbitalea soli]NEM90901.1 DUF3846 domain-containing protein [Galbitalea soli]NYJ31624.1 hypothetical protein [Galbitalea soli]